MSDKVSVKNVVKFAGAYVACAIGSGFATGQEIMQFFTAHGAAGIIGSVITLILFSWLGGTIMKHARELELEAPGHIVQYYFGNTLGRVFEVLFQAFLYAVFVIMIAGAGATLSEYYGLNPLVGRIGMAAVVFFSVTLDMKKLTDILGSMGTVIVFFAVIIGLISFAGHMDGIAAADEAMKGLAVTRSKGGWLFASVLYPGFNIVAVLVFSAGIGRSANNKREAFLGGVFGGVLFGAAILCMNLGMLAQIEKVFDKEVPSLVLADQLGRGVGALFSLILLCSIYTSAAPMLWSVSSQFAKERTGKFAIAALLLTISGLLLGLTDFSKLVGTIYPISGYMGILLMLFVLCRSVTDKSRESARTKGKERKE